MRTCALAIVLVMLILPAAIAASEWDGTIEILSISNDGVKIRLAGFEMGSDKSNSRQLPCPWERDPYFGLRDLFTCSMLVSAEITEEFETVRVFFLKEKIKLVRVIVASSYDDLTVEVVTGRRTHRLLHGVGNTYWIPTHK